jgi:hypothetical protein
MTKANENDRCSEWNIRPEEMEIPCWTDPNDSAMCRVHGGQFTPAQQPSQQPSQQVGELPWETAAAMLSAYFGEENFDDLVMPVQIAIRRMIDKHTELTAPAPAEGYVPWNPKMCKCGYYDDHYMHHKEKGIPLNNQLIDEGLDYHEFEEATPADQSDLVALVAEFRSRAKPYHMEWNGAADLLESALSQPPATKAAELRMTTGEYGDSIGVAVPFDDRDKPLCFGEPHADGCVHEPTESATGEPAEDASGDEVRDA